VGGKDTSLQPVFPWGTGFFSICGFLLCLICAAVELCGLGLTLLLAGHMELRPQDHRKSTVASPWPDGGEGAITKT
jgi:hypothetical protein